MNKETGDERKKRPKNHDKLFLFMCHISNISSHFPLSQKRRKNI